MKGHIISTMKRPLFWVIAIEILICILLASLGFKITYAPLLENKWTAVAACGQWAGAVAAIIIPFAVAYFSVKLQKNIGQTNADTLTEVKDAEARLNRRLDEELIKINQYSAPPQKTEAEKYQELKEKALKFVNISMFAKTDGVAKYLGIANNEAYHVLEELRLHDEAISSGGLLSEENTENIIWLKKRR